MCEIRREKRHIDSQVGAQESHAERWREMNRCADIYLGLEGFNDALSALVFA